MTLCICCYYDNIINGNEWTPSDAMFVVGGDALCGQCATGICQHTSHYGHVPNGPHNKPYGG